MQCSVQAVCSPTFHTSLVSLLKSDGVAHTHLVCLLCFPSETRTRISTGHGRTCQRCVCEGVSAWQGSYIVMSSCYYLYQQMWMSSLIRARITPSPVVLTRTHAHTHTRFLSLLSSPTYSPSPLTHSFHFSHPVLPLCSFPAPLLHIAFIFLFYFLLPPPVSLLCFLFIHVKQTCSNNGMFYSSAVLLSVSLSAQDVYPHTRPSVWKCTLSSLSNEIKAVWLQPPNGNSDLHPCISSSVTGS